MGTEETEEEEEKKEDGDGEADGDEMEMDDDGNMYVMEEEIRMSNVDTVKTKKENEAEEIGKDYHAMPGWNSFRTGKDGKRLERRERARQVQNKIRTKELKRSKKEGRQSELD